MATIFDNRTETAYTPVREDEATIHNANIKEKYRQLLQSAEEDQLSESFSRAERSSSARASVLSPERPSAPERVEPSFQPAPFRPEAPAEEHVTVHTRVDSPLFTPEMLERTMRGGEAPVSDFGGAAEMYAPAAEMYAAEMPAAVPMAPAVAEMPVAAVNTEAAEESYGLSAFAIRMIAAFAAAVVMLLTVIGINSYVIRQKTNQLRNLEQRREQLVEETEALEMQIEEATSYEAILEYAQEHGMIPAGE